MNTFTIRFAAEPDTALILRFIRELAEYERMSDEVSATEELLYDSLFVTCVAEAVIGEEDGAPAAFALFFKNFSTFLGRPGLYLEDIFVRPPYRGKGYGTAILRFLAVLARERQYGRMEWACLDWNQPAITFYKQLGARAMDEWTVYRLDSFENSELRTQNT